MRALILPILLLIGGIACQKNTALKGAENILRRAHFKNIKSLDPAVAYDEYSWDVVGSIYETLYQYDYLSDPIKVTPLLAADLPKYSKDKRTLTIPVRRGIRFSDDPAFEEGKGRELVAQDFVYAWKRLADPRTNSPGFWIFQNKVVGLDAYRERLKRAPRKTKEKAFNTTIRGLYASDTHSIVIKLKKPNPQLLYALALPFSAPVAREVIEKYADRNGINEDHPVGTGPYLLKSHVRGQKIVLERNPNYHTETFPTYMHSRFQRRGFIKDAGKALPFTAKVEIDILNNMDTGWEKFINGELDMIAVPKSKYSEVVRDQFGLQSEYQKRGVKLSVEGGNTFFFVQFNMKDSLIGKNRKLRQAISCAIDRKEFIKRFTENRGQKALSTLPPGVPGRVEVRHLKYDYNPERSKRLMVEAGFPRGEGLSPISIDMRGSDALNRSMGDFLTASLKKVGIDLKIIYNSFSSYVEKVRKGEYQMGFGGWIMDYPDPENVFRLLYGKNLAPGPNDTQFQNKEFDELFEQIAGLLPGPKRTRLIKEIEAVVQEEVPWALLYYNVNYDLVQPWVSNYRGNRIILSPYKYLRVDTKMRMSKLEAAQAAAK